MKQVCQGASLFWTSTRQCLMLKNVILTRWIHTTLILAYEEFFQNSIVAWSRQKYQRKVNCREFPSSRALRTRVPEHALPQALILFLVWIPMRHFVFLNNRPRELELPHHGVELSVMCTEATSINKQELHKFRIDPAHLVYVDFPWRPTNPVLHCGADFAFIPLSVVCL